MGHWLMRIATNACLNELARKKRRMLPIEREPSAGLAPIVELEIADWIGPAPFDALEARESVALAFLALLQRLPPKQRAVLLLKDVVGWSAEEIASALELTVSSVNSALHRARETVKAPPETRREPEPDVLQAYMRSWEAHDVDGLVAMLRDDIVFAMPPHATWFDGRVELERFFRESRFAARWAEGFRVLPTRANGRPAFAFFHGRPPQLASGRRIRRREGHANHRVHRRAVFPRLRTVCRPRSVYQGMTDPKTVALAYIEACGRRDLDAVAQLLAPDVHFTGPNRSIEGATPYLAALRNIGPIWRGSEIKKVFVNGAEAACCTTS